MPTYANPFVSSWHIIETFEQRWRSQKGHVTSHQGQSIKNRRGTHAQGPDYYLQSGMHTNWPPSWCQSNHTGFPDPIGRWRFPEGLTVTSLPESLRRKAGGRWRWSVAPARVPRARRKHLPPRVGVGDWSVAISRFGPGGTSPPIYGRMAMVGSPWPVPRPLQQLARGGGGHPQWRVPFFKIPNSGNCSELAPYLVHIGKPLRLFSFSANGVITWKC